MFATGLSAFLAKQLQKWKRFVPLFVGFWFPITVVITPIIFGASTTTLIIVSLYSIIGWALLGLCVYSSADKDEKIKDAYLVHSLNS